MRYQQTKVNPFHVAIDDIATIEALARICAANGGCSGRAGVAIAILAADPAPPAPVAAPPCPVEAIVDIWASILGGAPAVTAHVAMGRLGDAGRLQALEVALDAALGVMGGLAGAKSLGAALARLQGRRDPRGREIVRKGKARTGAARWGVGP